MENLLEIKEERSIELTCRLCLMDRGNYQPIFEFEGDQSTSSWISELTSLEIIQTPETPASLCQECKSTLEAFDTFRKACIRNDKLYKEMFLNRSQQDNVEAEYVPEINKLVIKEDTSQDEDELIILKESFRDPVNKEIELVLYLEGQHKRADKLNARKSGALLEKLEPISEKNRKQLCTICNKYVSRLNQHKLVHAETKRFQCEFCSRGFNQLSNLTKHVRTHTKEKPYKCNYCDKGFANSTELKVHLRIHTQEKPFSCGDCGKSFVTSGHLTRHSRSHSGVKPYSCEVCAVKFSTSSHLVRHRRLHSLEYPYSCTLCEERFMRTDYLKAHRCKLQE